MAINWTELKNDWESALNKPSTTNNVKHTVGEMIDALKKQLDNADVTGTDTRGDAIVNGKVK